MRRPASAAANEAAPPCFTVVDALSERFRLTKRSSTLRGSVPLRVAQACVPLLEGNAFGFQLCLTEPLCFERSPLGWSLALPQDEQAALVIRHARALERLVAAGFLGRGDRWHRFLAKEVLFSQPPRRLGRRPRLRLWTGLLVRPEPGVALRLFSAANRRPHSFTVHEEVFLLEEPGDPAHAFVPLVLELTLAPAAERARSLTLSGELACLAPLPTQVEFTAHTLAERPEVGRSHAAFYSPSYFQKKGSAATRRYRKQIDVGVTEAEAGGAACEVVITGPAEGATDWEIVRVPQERPRCQLEHVLYRNLLDFTFRFDGAAVAFAYDKELLARKGRMLWQRFRDLYGPEFVSGHEGALLYLSKYFTTHPPGEPHFFVKPWAFTRTPPGWSSLIEGSHGDGYDVLRGVIATDQFHATPAVFSIFRADDEIAVSAGTPLVRVFPLPRSLLRAGYRLLPAV